MLTQKDPAVSLPIIRKKISAIVCTKFDACSFCSTEKTVLNGVSSASTLWNAFPAGSFLLGETVFTIWQ